MVFDFKTYGCYPKEYNREVHGPYDPSRYYGKADTPLAEVKLGELPAWLGRRSLNPRRWIQAMDRAVWRYYDRWIFPKRIGAAVVYQVAFMLSASFYVINYHRIQHERHFKYH